MRTTTVTSIKELVNRVVIIFFLKKLKMTARDKMTAAIS